MKKVSEILLILVLTFSFAGCFYSARVNKTEIIIESTSEFSEEEIYEAAKAVKEYFKENFRGCELKKLVFNQKDHETECEYQISQGHTKGNILFFNHYSEIYCFWPNDESMEQGMTYEWSFTLVRKDENSPWEVISYGYA